MTKLIHTADIHLDSPLKSLALRDPELRDRVQAASRTAFSRIVDTALTEEVAALLIAGDLFDGAERSARTAAYLTAELDRLRRAGIRVYYIKGNHDAENPITGELTLPDNVHIFTGRGGRDRLTDDIWIHGVSFSDRHAPDSLLPKFASPVAGAVNIAMLHTSLAGAAGHDTYAPCSVAELAATGFDYWALGHVHRRQVHSERPFIVMPGNPQGRDIGEAGPRSATLINVEDGRLSIAEIATAPVIFAAETLDISGIDSPDALRDTLRHALHGIARALSAETGILRLTLSGATPLHWQILRDRDVWEGTVRGFARDTGRLWIEKLTLDLSDARDTPPSGAIPELARLMAEIRSEPGFAAALRADLEALMGELPATRRAALLPDADSADRLVAEIAAQGAEAMLARMRGAS